jgi:hypothetical protein
MKQRHNEFTHEELQIEELLSESNIVSIDTPTFFTKNNGQFHDEVYFKTRISGVNVFFCKHRILSVFTYPKEGENKSITLPGLNKIYDTSNDFSQRIVLSSTFISANDDVSIYGKELCLHHHNYYRGNNPENWCTHVPNYHKVFYDAIYPGINLVYYSVNSSLKYDFIVSPGVNPDVIQIQYDLIEQDLHLTSTGELVIETSRGSLIEKQPFIYQKINGNVRKISGRYEVKEENILGFKIEDTYDTSYPLVIDPEIVYSTFLGGTDNEVCHGIAVDSKGNTYVTGTTSSADFPVTNSYDGFYNGNGDVFVSKFSPSTGGTDSLLYSTFLGGSSKDNGVDIEVDFKGDVYVTGNTYSSDFPTVAALDDTLDGSNDAFIVKMSPSLGGIESLLFSSFLGGTGQDGGINIAVDSEEKIYVVGITDSPDFPVVDPYDDSLNGSIDGFIVQLAPIGAERNTLLYSTYLGGSGIEIMYGMTIDSNASVYVCGDTDSFDFPILNPLDSDLNGTTDGFVTKVSPEIGNTSSLVFSSYLGGISKDGARDITIDTEENFYVTGWTYSPDFPTVNPFDKTHNGFMDVFISKFLPKENDSFSLSYSTYLGGTNQDVGYGIAVDDDSTIYVVGETRSSDFWIAHPFDNKLNGDNDGFITVISPLGNTLVCSGFLGGTQLDKIVNIGLDKDKNIYVIGQTLSDDFPLVKAYDDSFDGDVIYNIYDGFVTKISLVDIPPFVEIVFPEESAIYIADIKIMRRIFSSETLVLGKITVLVNAVDDESKVERVEFYLDDVYQETVDNPPFSWVLQRGDFTISRHTIEVVAYDLSGNNASTTLSITKVL